jgi:hypothetical protein
VLGDVGTKAWQGAMVNSERKNLWKQENTMAMEEEKLLEHVGEQMDLDTLEFIQAIDRFKRKTQKLFPSWSEILQILRSLGYRKVDG